MTIRHVRSWDTRTSVRDSQAELRRTLERYGVQRVKVDEDLQGHIVTVSFTVADHPGAPAVAPIELLVDYDTVRRALGEAGKPATWEQAERVAWRHLCLLVDAGLTVAQAGLMTVTEFFLAHRLVRGPDGQRARFAAVLAEAGNPDGWFVALPPGREP